MHQWDEIKIEFKSDGSLRDIYVENIEVFEWDNFLDFLRSSKYKLKFSHGEQSIEIPESFGLIRELQGTEPTTLFIWLNDNIQLNCHFFISNEIELDLSPYDFNHESEYLTLIEFLESLSAALKKKVILTHEGMQEQIILSITNY
ncbi:hypothetical protein [Aliivibrio fischeri]|uniref:hypothetical protein n=1 Tax=Aliivibrio fischeri TaxID=668 RepID=UPI0018C5E8F9|nr:hypothetical protein [Aliivibrio fischeri]